MKKSKKNLALRINQLIALGLKLTQLAEASGISYTSLHRFIHAKDIALTEETQASVNANLDKWLKKLGAA